MDKTVYSQQRRDFADDGIVKHEDCKRDKAGQMEERAKIGNTRGNQVIWFTDTD